MGKYFGTDGIRGVYGEKMTEELAFKAGAAFGFLSDGVCVAARDTRLSGGALLDAFASGLSAAGVNVLTAGIVPTPALSLLVKKKRAFGGVMVSASHNPSEYNGLKLFGPGGVKLSAAEEAAVEFYIDNQSFLSKASLKDGGRRGRISALPVAAEIYIDSIIACLTTDGDRLDGVKVWLDCGFGAAGAAAFVSSDGGDGSIAREVFSRLSATVVSLNEGGDGSMINAGCGALYAGNLRNLMIARGAADIGFAFDGDADRMVSVAGGEVLDGDSALYALSHMRKGGVVGTVMSNFALRRRLAAEGKEFFEADVGDKNIFELMRKKGCNLGGEQSGHYIFYPERATGDGLLAAVKMTEAYLKGRIARLTLVPQKTVSLFCRPEILQSGRLKKLIAEAEKALSRVVVRLSGTEPKIRIMGEDEDGDKLDLFLERFREVVEGEDKE